MTSNVATPPRLPNRLWWWLATLATLVLVAAVYWPVLDAGLVWDDIANFKAHAWLYYGDEWLGYLLSGYNQWSLYFRPLGVALYVLEARLLHGDTTAMHALSLGIHLGTVALLIALARTTLVRYGRAGLLLGALIGLLYGLHPKLVVPVIWISSHDPLLVACILGALLASIRIQRLAPRAMVVSLCFLCGALLKESAAALPVFVVLLDWVHRGNRELPLLRRAWDVFRRNWSVYAALVATGILYLLARHWAIGSSTPGALAGLHVPDLAQLDKIAWLYLQYWGIALGFIGNMNPFHTTLGFRFGVDPWLTAMHVAAALAVLGIGLLVFSRRFAATGAAVIAVSLSLAPFIGIIPVTFDNSLYHERYAMIGIAMLCVLAPYILREWWPWLRKLPMLAALLPLLPVLWLALAIPSIRSTIPLWSDNLTLWKWAVMDNPRHRKAWGNLMNAYTMAGQYNKASAAFQHVLGADIPCKKCYVTGLVVAVSAGNAALADQAIERIHVENILQDTPGSRYYFLRAKGRLQLRLGQPDQAVKLLRKAIALQLMDPAGHIVLAEALVATGDMDAARDQVRLAVAMTYPPNRPAARRTAELILAGKAIYGKQISAAHTAPNARTALPAPPGG